jgi:NAD+ synthase (glutamine-hydrolysing)
VAAVLADILDTEISPELVPSNEGDNADPAQRSEDLVGPFELQDFNLYYLTRYGLAPSDIVYLAEHAWADRNAGHWPEGIPAQSRREYSRQEIVAWMRVFITRFFTSQFKRSAVPNGPKVGSGGSLSPRGDWRAPSDASPTLWLEELEKNVPAE